MTCLKLVSVPQSGSALTNPHNLSNDHRGRLTLMQQINKLLTVSTESGFCGSVKRLELNYQHKKRKEGNPTPVPNKLAPDTQKVKKIHDTWKKRTKSSLEGVKTLCKVILTEKVNSPLAKKRNKRRQKLFQLLLPLSLSLSSQILLSSFALDHPAAHIFSVI